jgi:hypothetical protein
MAKKVCAWYTQHRDDVDSTSGLEAVISQGGTAAALVELFTLKQVCTHSDISIHDLFYDTVPFVCIQ